MNVDIPIWETLIRLTLAVVLGGLIGWEREHRGKPAGLRTNMMVSLGAATFTLMSVGMVPESASTDPSRIVTGVATGIGFLGAGSIIKTGATVSGITTAAGIWVVGSVGAAAGVGAYSVATAATVVSLIVLFVFGKIETHAMDGDHDTKKAQR
jgi:putative Mg2+ transporter-C (MgtC) family protein